MVNRALPENWDIALQVREALERPFPVEDVGWLPKAVSQDQKSALALAYIDARMVSARLDEVLGTTGWKEDYKPGSDGLVVCYLSVRLPGQTEWVVKQDIGGPSDQPDKADKVKAAFSDSLKRAGVKVGIGRYLSDLPRLWCPYDAKKKAFTQFPAILARWWPHLTTQEARYLSWLHRQCSPENQKAFLDAGGVKRPEDTLHPNYADAVTWLVQRLPAPGGPRMPTATNAAPAQTSN
jgi:hypothetical protein